MSYNVIGYIVFLSVIYFITFHVGWKFYKTGAVYIHTLLPNDPHLVQSINKLLLVGYYLLNLGYATVSVSRWPDIKSVEELCACLSDYIGFIFFMLAVMHYFNLFWLLMYGKYQSKEQKSIHT